jgi:hypothetical protein
MRFWQSTKRTGGNVTPVCLYCVLFQSEKPIRKRDPEPVTCMSAMASNNWQPALPRSDHCEADSLRLLPPVLPTTPTWVEDIRRSSRSQFSLAWWRLLRARNTSRCEYFRAVRMSSLRGDISTRTSSNSVTQKTKYYEEATCCVWFFQHTVSWAARSVVASKTKFC